MDTSIYTRQGLQCLPQTVNAPVDSLLHRRKIDEISSQVCIFSRQYLFQGSRCVGYAIC